MKPINIEALYSKLAKTGSLTGFRPRDRFVLAAALARRNESDSIPDSLSEEVFDELQKNSTASALSEDFSCANEGDSRYGFGEYQIRQSP